MTLALASPRGRAGRQQWLWRCAGAAAERIDHGKNGFLYDPENIQDLSDYLIKLYSDNFLREKMAKESHFTALSWRPEKGRDILIDNAI